MLKWMMSRKKRWFNVELMLIDISTYYQSILNIVTISVPAGCLPFSVIPKMRLPKKWHKFNVENIDADFMLKILTLFQLSKPTCFSTLIQRQGLTLFQCWNNVKLPTGSFFHFNSLTNRNTHCMIISAMLRSKIEKY